MSFADRLSAAQEAARAGADQAITGLAGIARSLEMPTRERELTDIAAELRSDLFKITIFGRFKAGKSTLLNAILADVTHPVDLYGAPGPLPAGDLPCSAVLTELVYSAEPWVKVWGRDETCEQWTLERYLREAQLDPMLSGTENQRKFDRIRRFEVGYPARLLQSVVLVDTPGTDEELGREVIAKKASADSDAVLLAFSSQALFGTAELADSEAAVDGKLGVFTVVNVREPQVADDRMRARTWNAYLRPQLADPDAQPWVDQDLEGAYRVYFVDALRSLQARQRGDEVAVKAAGLAAFEDRLAHFLTTERSAAHIVNHVHRAQPLALEIAEWIRDRQAAYQASQEEFEVWSKKMQIALYEAQRRGATIREITAAQRRDLVARLVAKQDVCESRIREDLQQHLMQADIPALDNLLGAIRPKTVQMQLEDETKRFVTHRRTEMLDDAGRQLDAALERLTQELGRELDRAVEPVAQARLEMPGREDFPEDFRIVSRGQQIAGVAIAVVTGNAFAAVGAGGGIRPVLGGMGGMLLGGLLLGALGVVSLPVVIPVALVASLLGALGVNLIGGGVRARFVEKLVPHLKATLKASQEESRQKLTQQIESLFDGIGAQVERDFQVALDQQRAELTLQVQARTQESHMRNQRLAQLERASATVAQHRATLTAAVRTGRQTLAADE